MTASLTPSTPRCFAIPEAGTKKGEKAKLPFDYIVSGLRALSAEEKDLRDLGLAAVKAKPAAAGRGADSLHVGDGMSDAIGRADASA